MNRLDRASEQALATSRALVGVAVRSLAPALEKMSLQQYRVLVLLAARGPLRSGVLAEELGIHASTLSRLVDRLVLGGWVERLESPSSRREVLVDIAPPGRDLVGQVTARRAREVRSVLRRVKPGDVDAVLNGLRLFADAAGEPDVGELARLGVEGGVEGGVTGGVES